MIWAGISLSGRTALVVVPGNLNGGRYIDKILRTHIVPYLGQIGQIAIFQDDYERSCTTSSVSKSYSRQLYMFLAVVPFSNILVAPK